MGDRCIQGDAPDAPVFVARARPRDNLLLGSWVGWLIIAVPIEAPKFLEFYQFDVSVGAPDVDGSRQLLADGHVFWRHRSRLAAVSGECAATDGTGVGGLVLLAI